MEWKLFWKLWFQKNLRNLASAKYQWMLYLFILTWKGMFTAKWVDATHEWVAIIPAAVGLAFLGGGFVTFALGRFFISTKLIGNGKNDDKYKTGEVLKTE